MLTWAQTVYHPFFIICYNVFYTSLPVLVLGIFEQDVCDALSTRYPGLYWPGIGNNFFNPRNFASCALHGVATSVVVFFVPIGTYAAFHANEESSSASVGFICVVLHLNLQHGLRVLRPVIPAADGLFVNRLLKEEGTLIK